MEKLLVLCEEFSASAHRWGRDLLTAASGGPAALGIITVFHLAVRAFLAPLIGKFLASAVALAVVLAVLVTCAGDVSQNPAALYGYLGWGVNLAGAAAAEALKKFSSGGAL